MGYELEKLKRLYGVSTPSMAPYAGEQLGAPPTAPTAGDAAAAEKYATDKVAFDEQLRKYQIGQKEYANYKGDYQGRLQSTNMYNQPQFMADPTKYVPQNTTQLKTPTYGAIPATLSTAEEQGGAYKKMRDLGYTDADIRKATSGITGTPTEQKWGDMLTSAYSQYAPAVQAAYGTLGRSGFGTEAGQIDTPGYSYWLNQLGSGAVKPEDLNKNVLAGSGAAVPSNYGDIYSTYQKYFGRAPEASGVQYWGQTGLTGDALQKAIIGGAQGSDLDYYQKTYGGNEISTPAMPGAVYARGGHVRTHYQTGGGAQVGDLMNVEEYGNQPPYPPTPSYPMSSRLFGGRMPRNVEGPINTSAMDLRPNIGEEGTVQARSPLAGLMDIGNTGEGMALSVDEMRPRIPGLMDIEGIGEGASLGLETAGPGGGGAAAAAGAPGAAQPGGLEAMLQRYGRQGSDYSAELRSARARANAESQAFSRMLQNMINSPESDQTSKAEMYFRLASAFGSPTKTGHFTENLSLAGKEMAEYAKGQRASASERRKLALEGQKLQMEGAKADLNTLRAMAQEEMRDQRALQTALIQEYIRSGQPQSNAGRMAKDMGLTPGTPEYQAAIERFAELDVSKQIQKMNIESERLRLSQAALALREEAGRKLSPLEINMRRETEDNISGAQRSLTDLQNAYRLNANSFGNGYLDRGKRFLADISQSEAPIAVNTRELENLLGQQGLEKLKATFGGNPTEGERRILLDLEGIGAKTLEDRSRIIRRAYEVLQERIRRQEGRLQDILSGKYGEKSSTPSGGQP